MWPISPQFEYSLKAPVHAIRVKMQVLDTDFNVVKEFSDTGDELSPTNFIVDGAVDIDITRGTRRTFTLNLLNSNGEFSPDSAWGGTFYVNRLVRVYRGIAYSSAETELVPVGTFMIDHADVVVERNMSMVVLSGSDLWKKVAKSKFAHPASWAAGTSLVTVIKAIASAAGVTLFVDDLSDDRVADARNLNKKFSVEQGDVRGDAILKLAAAYGLDVYFDPLGRMVIADYRSPEDTAVVWKFDPDDNRMLISARQTYKDDALYNHAVVVATGSKATITAEMKDTDPSSVTNINRIGDRVYMYETDSISTAAAAAAAVKKLFYQNILITEDVVLDAICNPALDGNDVISVREPDFAKIDARFRIRGMNVPLASSRQTIRLMRNINLG